MNIPALPMRVVDSGVTTVTLSGSPAQAGIALARSVDPGAHMMRLRGCPVIALGIEQIRAALSAAQITIYSGVGGTSNPAPISWEVLRAPSGMKVQRGLSTVAGNATTDIPLARPITPGAILSVLHWGRYTFANATPVYCDGISIGFHPTDPAKLRVVLGTSNSGSYTFSWEVCSL